MADGHLGYAVTPPIGIASKDGMEVETCILSASSDLGEQYIRAMTLAGEYDYAGRDWVCDRVARILGATIVESVHNHHNFAWREEHDGELYWVVRKGATPGFPQQKGFVGGTMAAPAVILEGVESEESKLSLYSTVRGAGRVTGRREATGLIDRKTGEVKRAAKITREMMDARVAEARVELRGAGVDESPHCYKATQRSAGGARHYRAHPAHAHAGGCRHGGSQPVRSL